MSKGTIVLDGTIQRFEFTFELASKLMKAMLIQEGVDASTPRAVIKEAYRAKIIQDGDGWIDMLEDRNKTSHLYDEQQAKMIFNKIKQTHVQLLQRVSHNR